MHGLPPPCRGERFTDSYGFHQYENLTRKMLFAGALERRLSARPVSKFPTLSLSERSWVQTRNSVEPGENSQRRTAFPRSETREKLGSSISCPAAGPAVPSGSTTIRS